MIRLLFPVGEFLDYGTNRRDVRFSPGSRPAACREATADPARTDDFAVTSVRVVGPLWGLQSRDGYDMRPNTSLTIAELRRFFTPWRYDPLPMAWDGRYVSIQPVPSTLDPDADRSSLAVPLAAPAPWNAPRAV